MALRRLDFRGFTGDRKALREAVPSPTDEQERSSEAVAAIIGEVRSGGDAALRRLTAKFDGVDLDELRVPAEEIGAALGRVPSELQDALDIAHDRILAYHAHESAAAAADDFDSGGIRVRHLVRPVGRAGCYAPGGRARYPSTVLMCAVPAHVAGVEEIVLCVPPGPDGMAWLITWSEAVAEAVAAHVDRIVKESPRRADLEATLGAGGFAVLVDGPKQAIAIANIVAPEHLEILTGNAESLLSQVTSAGAVFLGPNSPASMGDYLAGPNHVLPTNRTARFASALRVDDFQKHIHAVSVSDKAIEELGPHVVTLAETEGLPAHAQSVRLRWPR